MFLKKKKNNPHSCCSWCSGNDWFLMDRTPSVPELARVVSLLPEWVENGNVKGVETGSSWHDSQRGSLTHQNANLNLIENWRATQRSPARGATGGEWCWTPHCPTWEPWPCHWWAHSARPATLAQSCPAFVGTSLTTILKLKLSTVHRGIVCSMMDFFLGLCCLHKQH